MRRTKEEATATRACILDAAERTFFERGVARTSLNDIACAAGVTRGAIYWHFKNKGDIFDAMLERVRMPMDDIFYRIMDSGAPDAIDSLRRLCTESFLKLYQDPRTCRVYTIVLVKCDYTGEMIGPIQREAATRTRVLDRLSTFFARLQQSGAVTTPRPPRLLAIGLYAFMLGLYADYLRTPDNYRMPDDAASLVGLFFDTLS